jgi:hypothetical protein
MVANAKSWTAVSGQLSSVPDAYRVYLADFGTKRRTVAFQNACPVRSSRRAYVKDVVPGQFERAYLIARNTNPYSRIFKLITPHASYRIGSVVAGASSKTVASWVDPL